MTLPARISLVLTALFSTATLALVIYAVGWDVQEDLGAALVTYSTVPLFGALAVGPYVLAYRQALHAATPLWAWAYMAVNVGVAAAALPIYGAVFLTGGPPDISPNVIFVVFPGCQLLLIGGVIALEHIWRRQNRAADLDE